MRVLIIGSGGREHALAWKLAQECEVHAAPGNPGIAEVAQCHAGGPVDVAKALQPDLVVIGPENPLIEGLADLLRAEGLAVFGPGADGARLEASKAFSKELMQSAAVPTAAFQTFADPVEAKSFAASRFDAGRQVAVKASGAALGKGVVVASTLAEAEDAIEMMMVERELGDAGATVVIEDRLVGREFSLLTVCSDSGLFSLPVCQDYKRALDNDRGPNTGGMGSVCRPSWVTPDLIAQTEATVVAPILDALANQDIPYRGLLFSGLMVQEDVAYCLEYNVRFGDPETQSVVRLIGTGFAELLRAAAVGDALPQVFMSKGAAVTVVLASGGYPGTYRKGLPITIPQMPAGVVAFHSGTALKEGSLVTNGGRVLGLSAYGETHEKARQLAYNAASGVAFEASFYRTDIGT